jgi:peptidylprolyl isomerase/peptidyl-prolyl cis-trans isomerase B (cyclophilin B)
MKKIVGLLFCWVLLFSCKEKNTEQRVELSTPYGNIKVRLYNETPLHRDNFVRLVESGFYDGILFHRVINGFMIQAGDPASKNAATGAILGEESFGEEIPAEVLPQYIHRKGVLAAAREPDEVNPERKSSGSHFYLVQGEVYTPEALNERVEQIKESRKTGIYRQLKSAVREDFSRMEASWDLAAMEALTQKLTETCDSLFVGWQLVLTEEQISAYTTVGGIPHLDGLYTVFGEITEGLEVLDRIAAVKTDENDRPLKNLPIKAKIIR